MDLGPISKEEATGEQNTQNRSAIYPGIWKDVIPFSDMVEVGRSPT